MLAAVRALKDSTRVRGGLAVGAGIVLALGFAFVMIVGAHPPLVECENDQVTISDTYWFWPGSPNRGSGSGTMSPDGTNWGTVTSRGKTYSYVCGQDELVSFRRVD